jgi:hypothetical protein
MRVCVYRIWRARVRGRDLLAWLGSDGRRLTNASPSDAHCSEMSRHEGLVRMLQALLGASEASTAHAALNVFRNLALPGASPAPLTGSRQPGC